MSVAGPGKRGFSLFEIVIGMGVLVLVMELEHRRTTRRASERPSPAGE